MNTLLLKKQKKYYRLQLRLFVSGIGKVKSALLELHPTYGDTILRIYKTLLVAVLLLKRKKKSVTVECLQGNKWMTLNDKRIFSDNATLITSWLQTSVLGLIGNGKALKPFWTEQCVDISQRLWLPIETASVGSPLNFWSGSSSVMESHSWFSMKKMDIPQTKNSPMTFYPSYMFIPVEKWDADGTLRIRTRKIRLYPTPKQKKVFKMWMGTRRFLYNKVLDKIKNGLEEINFFDLRNKFVTAKNVPTNEKWQLETPKDIRAGAIRDLVKNYKTAFANLKNRQINHFKMGFVSKRDSPSIEIPKEALKMKDRKLSIYPRSKIGEIKVAKRDSKNLKLDYYCRLQFKHDKWFLIAPMDVKTQQINGRREYCSLDPGIRSFQTVYSEDLVAQIKVNKETIKKLQTKMDFFKSLRDRKIIKRKRWKRKERNIFFRMTNLIDDLHHKTANFLTKTFNIIFLPKFESQEIAKKNKIRCVNRDLLQLKHYSFQQRLKAKCDLRNCRLDLCTEEYTSKTCGRCGCLSNVGSKDVFTCGKCNLVIDRDVNGARNIAIKRLKEIDE